MENGIDFKQIDADVDAERSFTAMHELRPLIVSAEQLIVRVKPRGRRVFSAGRSRERRRFAERQHHGSRR